MTSPWAPLPPENAERTRAEPAEDPGRALHRRGPAGRLAGAVALLIARPFAGDHPHRVITAASQILSDLTHFAGIVVSPRRRGAALRHIEFFGLSEKRVLLIIVASDGEVQNRVLVTDRAFTPSQLQEAANYINQHYAGVEFDLLRSRVRSELIDLHRDISALMQAA